MTVFSKICGMCLLTSDGITSMSGSEIKIEDVEQVMNSEATAVEKTNFFIQYLLAQREAILNYLFHALCTFALAILVFIIGRKIVKKMLKMTSKWMEKNSVEVDIQRFVMSCAGLVYNILLIFIVAGILGVGASSIFAMLGSAGLAIGLALQGSLSNFAGGVLILLLKPFKVGDYIVAVGEEGTVESIDIFYTRIHTTDNKVVVIPNGTISNSSVTNTSNQEDRMLILDFMVPYHIETAKVRGIVMGVMRREERICHDKDMSVIVFKLNPARVKMQARAWVKNSDYWNTRFSMLETMKEELLDEGIDIS
ncbi:MAG TPA: mechanosensitive ion channel protein [Lachnospiraceae bacterium]|nr:mechanosensitive ion channel protein [Lachnospiraceae bacterium]